MSVSASPHKDIVVLVKTHTRSDASQRVFLKVAPKTAPTLIKSNTDRVRSQGVETSTAFFLHSSFFQTINTILPLIVAIRKVLQASRHLYSVNPLASCHVSSDNSSACLLCDRLNKDVESEVCLLVGCLINVPATCECISGTDLLRKVYVLPHWDRGCSSNFLCHPATVH